MKKMFLTMIFLLSITAVAFAADISGPKNVKVIAQSTTSFGELLVTIIDLDNNELVIMEYSPTKNGNKNYALLQVIRTGSYVDPKIQQPITN